MPDKSKARLMFDVVSKAPMSARTRSTLQAFVTSGDCRGLMQYLEHCVATQRDSRLACGPTRVLPMFSSFHG